jgi:hypothetical protein
MADELNEQPEESQSLSQGLTPENVDTSEQLIFHSPIP